MTRRWWIGSLILGGIAALTVLPSSDPSAAPPKPSASDKPSAQPAAKTQPAAAHTGQTHAGPAHTGQAHAAAATLIRSRCVKCHNESLSEGGVRLDLVPSDLKSREAAALWRRAAEQVLLGQMPPRGQKPLTEPDAARLVNWVAAELTAAGQPTLIDPKLLPGFGNYVNHEQLFTMPAERKAATPARLWRMSPHIFKDWVNTLAKAPLLRVKPNQGGDGLHPALPYMTPTHAFRDQAAPHGFENATAELLFDMAWQVAGQQISDRIALEPNLGVEAGPQVKRSRSKSVPPEFAAVLSAKSPTAAEFERAIRLQFGLALQREPRAAELTALQTLAAKTHSEAPVRETLQTVLASVLMKPEAMFRSELGVGTPDRWGRVMLSPREVSFAVAFALTDALPDAKLQAAVADGKLSSAEDVRRELRRLLAADVAENPRILRFFQEYFEYPHVTQVFKDARAANAIFANERVWDADGLILHILRRDREVLRELLTTDRICVSPDKPMTGNDNVLRRYRQSYLPDYGLPSDWKWTEKQPFVPPTGKRSGILTHPAWLMAFSDNEKNQAVQRGHWIRTKLLGGTVPDVPIGVNAQFPDDPTLTLREKMHVTREAYCQKCHGRMDELGLPFEQFDDFGKYRTTERVLDSSAPGKTAKNGRAILSYRDRPLDTTGRVALTGDAELDGPVKDPFEMLERFAKSARVRQVFIRHAFRYWMGRNETLDDAPTLIDADRAYVESGGSMKALLVSLLSSDSFLYRRLPTAR